MINQSSTLRPAVAALIRHAEKFGPDCVVETARDYLAPPELAVLDLELARLNSTNRGPGRRRQRRTTVGLRDQVLALNGRGLAAAAIADTLNISDRRVANILVTGSPSENGGRKRLG
jgi:hypothetical protein